ncbi:unnamed protein product [Ceutorhynchus assimilis]|uniref:Ubiquitin-like protease family profile domain-containing protein n=1 Tax=Ceutorhynchus assimilis TaxID=467358 RepID=A0A9N9MHD5_9CUCU|nr:unnamed protein product [Ceutorhynchus assimilis]
MKSKARREMKIEKLQDFLEENYPKISSLDIIKMKSNNTILKDICMHLFKKNDKNSRHYVKTYFKRNKEMSAIRGNSKDDKFERFRRALIQLNIRSSDLFCVSAYTSDNIKSIYSKLCGAMKLKNSLKNRKKLQTYWKRHHHNFMLCSPPTSVNLKENKSDKIENFTPDDNESDNNSFKTNNSDNANSVLGSTEKNNQQENLFAPISSEKHDIPKEIQMLKFDDKTDSKTLLPIGTTNMRDENHERPSFSKCNYFEGTFQISVEEYNCITDNNSLIPQKYAYLINEKFQKVNSTCKLYFKESFYSERKDTLTVYCYCIHKQCKSFKLLILNPRKEIHYLKVEVLSSSLNFNHLYNLTSQLRGVERQMVGNSLTFMKPMRRRQKDTLSLSSSSVELGNLNVKSDCVYRCVRSEQLAKNDRDKDDILDVIEMQKDHPDYIYSVGSPFFVYIFSKEQNYLIAKLAQPIIHIDATGSIIRKPSEKSKKVYYYAGVIKIPENNRICAVFEMVSSNHDACCIASWLFNFKNYFVLNKHHWPPFTKAVVDFSFAFINAILNAWNNMDLVMYLKITFDMVRYKTKIPENIIQIHLCCFHVFKLFSMLISEHYPEQCRKMMKEIVAVAFNLNWNNFCKWFRNFYIITMSEVHSQDIEDAIEKIAGLSLYPDTLLEKNELTSQPEQTHQTNKDTQYEKSAFSQYFTTFVTTISLKICDSDVTQKNIYYNKQFYEIFFKRYIPYLPLWSGILSDGLRLSNAPAERWFGLIKNDVLDKIVNQKCSRVLRKIRNYVTFLAKENILNVRNQRCAKSDFLLGDQGLHSQETWNKKIKIAKPSNFQGNELKKILEFKTIRKENSDVENVICVYCRLYNDDNASGPIDWLQCDKCNNWIHKLCAEKTNISLNSDTFFCFKCSSSYEPPPMDNMDIISLGNTDNKNSNIDTYMEFFKKNFTENLDNLMSIEIKTRGQRNNNEWLSERKKRVTASNFGAICKARTEKSLLSICKNIINSKCLDFVPSIKHGIETEKVALIKYEQITDIVCQASGLQIHPKYQFLAGSPDGLVGTDGIIEIKCPFLIRNESPYEAIQQGKLRYMDKNGSLKTNSEYYYQIQGLLEITNREWCDFFIYTNRETLLRRIYRNKEFWIDMFHKLKAFYYFYMIPSLAKSMAVESPIKWNTQKKIEFFDNGLVNDFNYYLADIKKPIYICFYADAPCEIRELTKEDLITLTGTQWLNNFVVDICLYIFNNENIFNVITCNLSKIILCDGIVNDYILQQIQIFENDTVIMPFLINNNHYCLALCDFEKNELTYMDPFGNENMTSHPAKIYKNFLNFLEKYKVVNKSSPICTNNWKLVFKEHANQRDSHNCGVYIIYYFSQLTTYQPMNQEINVNHFRRNLLFKLLERSDDVKNRCIYCGNRTIDNVIQCHFCKRHFHKKLGCLNVAEFKQGICDLCSKY